MAVVVEQTLPFPASALHLDDPEKWQTLLPLIRPSVEVVQTSQGPRLLLDRNLAAKKQVHVIAISTAGNFSSKLLDDQHVTAIISSPPHTPASTSQEAYKFLQQGKIDLSVGAVLVRVGKSRKVVQHDAHTLEVETKSELESDHIIRLLDDTAAACRGSLAETLALLRIFEQCASTAHAKFHSEKAGGHPVLVHADGASGFEKARHAVERDLKHALQAHPAPSGQVVYSVHYADVNGLGRLENYILAGEIAQYLESQTLPHKLSHSTILNHTELARGWAVSLCAIPTKYLPTPTPPLRHTSPPSQTNTSTHQTLPTPKIPFTDASIRQRIESGCNAVIREEPTITEYDTIVGDGDCGYTLRDGAKKVLSFIANRDLTHLPAVVADLVAELEVNMGGTSGALYCIFLTALASALATATSVPEALQVALAQLMKYTKARVGDRTMMDALIPFIQTLAANGGNAEQALEKARIGVDGTKKMEAKLGRSTYLDESATRGVPDPGAYGLLVLFQGMCGV